jgi:hypothetical protein
MTTVQGAELFCNEHAKESPYKSLEDCRSSIAAFLESVITQPEPETIPQLEPEVIPDQPIAPDLQPSKSV